MLRRFKARERISYERLARLVDVSFMSLYRWIKMGIPPRNRSTIQKVDYFSKLSENTSIRQIKKPLHGVAVRQGKQRIKGRREAGLLAFSGQEGGRQHGAL
ncbi:MAG: hypothetical protein HY211_06435 [Candidatus Omnitrophica bacterium]|nr:hypothetical protein [Candidatus Omnitrophota bacterium]